jgi:hypothetical protein
MSMAQEETGQEPEAGAGTSRGRIGAEIFEQVEKLVATENLTRTQAFKRLSEETGRRQGTVAANYYRIARQRGAALQPRVRRGPGRPRGRGRGQASDTQAVISRAMSALEELGELARRQEQELGRLREENKQFDQVRKLMGSIK